MTSGEQCVVTSGTVLMPQWSASNQDMQPLEVSTNMVWYESVLVTITAFIQVGNREPPSFMQEQTHAEATTNSQ